MPALSHVRPALAVVGLLCLALVGLLALAPLQISAQANAGPLDTLAQVATAFSLAAAGLATVVGMRDAALKESVTLPTGAASAYSGTLDLEITALADPRGLELIIAAPAHTTGQLPDTKTITYTVQHDDAAGFGTVADLYGAVLTQTGAGGAGAAAAEVRVALPSTAKRYLRLKATAVATVAPAANAAATMQLIPDNC